MRFDRKDIGSANVRFPAGTGMPDPLDVAIDPYAKTKVAKQVYVKGFQAWPQTGGPFPAVIILHEWWGLNAHFQDLTYRLAQHGYVALAVDQYSRIGGAVTSDAEFAGQLMAKLKPSDVMQDLNAATEYLNFQEYVKKNRIAVLGFCMGGSHALSYACARRQLRAAVAFYGKVPQDTLSGLQCPVLYHQAEHDDWITQEEVDHLVQTLTARKVPCEVHKYPGTSHAFFNDTRPEVFNADAAAEAWARTLAFLDTYILADHPGVRPLPDSQRIRL
ncbi:MAG TPA: dienelactone hydrolase family protein [Nitrospirales bacterium]|jgi:carboxymethylenebutenolidase|nr:dienelactone hydrolase family protein [Nitrospirales bacterium]